MTASINGPREVAGAITASTLTTVAVFLPLGFVGGLVSQFFLPFALTVTFALLASLICALTVVPVLAYFLIDKVKLDVDENGEPTSSIWVRAYTPTIRFVLREPLDQARRRRRAPASCSSRRLALAPLLPTQFINAGSEKTLVVTVAPPTGASSEAVLAQADRGRDDPPRRPRRRAGPDQHPGRGRHQLPGLPVRPERPRRQQRDDDRPARGRRRSGRRRHRAPDGRARAGQDRRLRRRRSRPAAGSPPTA